MKWSKQTLNNIFFCLGLGMVFVMFFTFDVSFAELWQHICRAGYWLIPIVGIWILVYVLNALSWRAIIKGTTDDNACPVGSLRIYRLTISGYALNYATPVGGLGGEPYRIMELSKDIGKERAASSVILYSMMHMFSHFWFWFIAIFIYLILAFIGDLPLNAAIAYVLSIIFVVCLLAFYIFSCGYRNGFVLKVLHAIGHIPGLKGWSRRFIDGHAVTLANIDSRIAALHLHRCTFFNSLTLEYLSRVVQSLEIMFMLLLFGIDCGGGFDGCLLTFLHSILIVAFTSLFANLIGFLPMQLGVQEGGFVMSVAALGLSPALGIFVSIISRVRQMIWIVIGMLLMRIR